MPEVCPNCDEPFDHRISLDKRWDDSVDISDYDKLCRVRSKRSSGPTMKQTRSASEAYSYTGYLHTEAN